MAAPRQRRGQCRLAGPAVADHGDRATIERDRAAVQHRPSPFGCPSGRMLVEQNQRVVQCHVDRRALVAGGSIPPNGPRVAQQLQVESVDRPSSTTRLVAVGFRTQIDQPPAEFVDERLCCRHEHRRVEHTDRTDLDDVGVRHRRSVLRAKFDDQARSEQAVEFGLDVVEVHLGVCEPRNHVLAGGRFVECEPHQPNRSTEIGGGVCRRGADSVRQHPVVGNPPEHLGRPLEGASGRHDVAHSRLQPVTRAERTPASPAGSAGHRSPRRMRSASTPPSRRARRRVPRA